MRRFTVIARSALFASVIMVATATFAGCHREMETTGVGDLTTDPFFIRGTIRSSDHPWGFFVEGQPGTSYRVTSAHFTVGPNTIIRRADGSAATAADLQVGREIRLWITGVILESLPVQVSAQIVVID